MSDLTNETVKNIEVTLNSVDRALGRLREGTYRSCIVCGGEIEESILAGNPFSTTCKTHT